MQWHVKFGRMPYEELMQPLTAVSRSKGTRLECEICGKPATIQCVKCPTYYCSKDHFVLDWEGILYLIADDINMLRCGEPALGSEEERHNRAEELEKLRMDCIEAAIDTSHKYLIGGEQNKAIPGALYALKLTLELRGPESDKLVTPYLFLAEANLGLNRASVAEEFLALANWSLLKNPNPDHGLIATLHKNFGRLYALQRNWDQSVEAFAMSIYHASRHHGPLSPKTGTAYFAMGRVFQSRYMDEQAQSFFALILQIYSSYLNHVAQRRQQQSPEESNKTNSHLTKRYGPEKTVFTADPAVAFGALQKQSDQISQGVRGIETDMTMSDMELEEAVEVLRHIHNYRVRKVGQDHDDTKEAKLVYEGIKALLDEARAIVEAEAAAVVTAGGNSMAAIS